MDNPRAKREFKDAAYEQIVRITKALSSPKRYELLDLLSQRPWTVEELAVESSISIANASQHLKTLLAAQLVRTTKKGTFVEYSLSGDLVMALVRGVRVVAEHQLSDLARIRREFASGRKAIETIERTELLAKLKEGSALLLDVRPAQEYSIGHLAGALSIPLAELKKRLPELPRTKTIAAYCRGPQCLFASDAVDILSASGFKAVLYEESIADWKAHGLPVASGESQPPQQPEPSTRRSSPPKSRKRS